MFTAVSALMACALQCFLADTILARRAAALTIVKKERLLIAIEGMQCASCANGIKVMLKRTPGVISAEVSYDRREAEVEYDPSGTSPEMIIKAITNMGYKATVKEHRET